MDIAANTPPAYAPSAADSYQVAAKGPRVMIRGLLLVTSGEQDGDLELIMIPTKG
jgi:hypothetical protein